MPVIPATWEAEIRMTLSEASAGKQLVGSHFNKQGMRDGACL
jgi:hypothetical protein